MTLKLLAKPAVTVAAFAVFVLVAALLSSPHVRANDDERDADESKIRQGFEIAPVTLHLDGKDRDLVGLGSYIVNAQADCNGCHSNSAMTEFTSSGNPYLLRPIFDGKKKV